MAAKDNTPESSEAEVDLENLRVNFSEEEASSEARDYEPLPTGKYHVTIFDGEVAFSQSQANPGKPYWKLTLQVQDGKYEGRRLWGNVMLWDGALFSLAQILKAVGREDALKSGKIPAVNELIGKDLVVTAQKLQDTYKMEKEGIDPKTASPEERSYKTEVKGYKPWDGKPVGSVSSGSGSNSMLP